MVFCRLTCGKDEPDEVEARDGVCSIVAAIPARREGADIPAGSQGCNLAVAGQEVGQRPR